MSVNKFGMSLKRRDNDTVATRASIESLRNYMHENTLNLNGNNYDANKRKIQRLEVPTENTDATNKSYVDSHLEKVKNVNAITIRENVNALDAKHEKKIQEVKKTVERNESTLDSLGKKIQELQTLVERSIPQILSNRLVLETLQKEVQQFENLFDTYVKTQANQIKELQKTLEKNVRDLDAKYEDKILGSALNRHVETLQKELADNVRKKGERSRREIRK